MTWLKYLFIFIIFTIGIRAFAQDASDAAGTSSVLLLRIDPTARVSGFSGAFTGLSDDENALLYNPAGLATMQRAGVGLNHSQWLEDIRIDNLIAGYNLTRRLGIGLAITHLWMEDLQGKDEFGTNTTSISVSSTVAALGAGYSFLPGISAGLAFKYFQDKLGEFSANGIGFDAGLHFKSAVPGLRAGLAVQNIGSTITYDQATQNIPLTFRGGLAYHVFPWHLQINADVVKSRDTDLQIFSGLELVIYKYFILRFGNKYDTNEAFTPSFGAGFTMQNKYNIHYTYTSFSSELGATHRIGFTFNFDTPATRKKRSGILSKSTLPLVPPANVSVNLDKKAVIVGWAALSGQGYNVYARYGLTGEWKKLNSEPVYEDFMKFKKPGTGGTYFFKVCSVSSTGSTESNFSKEVGFDVE